jgi:SAM-dependent methyltransferase
VTSPYDRHFYDEITAWSQTSAEVIVPLVVDWVNPTSVLDVGCGRGTWLAAFAANGVENILGLDGDYVEREALDISADAFRSTDLAAPPDLDRRFDLAISLEVGEHLPARHADDFVAYLTRSAPVVLFSAAVPGQGGVHHVNEQWPRYWAERFAGHGYQPLDVVRPRVWDDGRVAFFFAQNMVLYAHEDVAVALRERIGGGGFVEPPSLVHPGMLDALREATTRRRPSEPSLSALVKALPGAAAKATRRRLRRKGAPIADRSGR